MSTAPCLFRAYRSSGRTTTCYSSYHEAVRPRFGTNPVVSESDAELILLALSLTVYSPIYHRFSTPAAFGDVAEAKNTCS